VKTTGVRVSAGFTLIELLIVVAIIGILAALGIPTLLRARVSANEAQVIGDSRSVVSAAQTYAAANCGWFASNLFPCMTWEQGGGICIPGYPPNSPQFLGADIARAGTYAKSGYSRTYTAGSALGVPPAPQCDPNSVTSYCYDSVPSSMGLTGVRSFVATSAGALYVDPAGNSCACGGNPQIPPAACVPLD